MRKRKFTKTKLSLEQQIKFLETQGLKINNNAKVQHVLRTIGYYRLSAYLLPFKGNHNNAMPRVFKQGISFDEIWQLYQFDRELRLLLSDAIEKVEVAFRASIADNTSEYFNPFWYKNSDYYCNKQDYQVLMKNIDKVLKDKQEVFIQHYLDNYDDPKYPPIWMIIETLSFGACSKMFANIKKISVRQAICKLFNQHTTIIESWLRTIVWVRNLYAHHARVWNRWLIQAPVIPKHENLYHYLQKRNRRFIVCAYILMRMLQQIAPKSPWGEKLYKLFEKYEQFPGSAMGFCNDWREDHFWELL